MTDTELAPAEVAPLTGSELDAMDAWWRAANYLSVGQIYLMANPLLTEPLLPEQIKPRLLGHWGTTPGQNMIYVHLNRVIRNSGLNMIYISGPGHGGPGVVASTYLEGTYTEVYPHITQDAVGMGRLFKQFSFPGGIPSHVAPETPGSIHEGGEPGYSLNHAYGAAFDNPDLIVACVIGDGESETGPLAGSWHANKFLNPARDGAVLPILHLNGYKIANPTVPARIPHEELESLLRGYGYTVHTVEGHDPKLVHQQLAATLDTVIGEIRAIQRRAREEGDLTRPAWPVIVFKTPKGWTGPKVVDGLPVEGTWRAHQVPLDAARTNPAHLAQLEEWMRSYHAEELFDANGTLRPEIARLAPPGDRRMSANPHANGGLLLRDLNLPDYRDYSVTVTKPGDAKSEATRVLGAWLRDVIKALCQVSGDFEVLGANLYAAEASAEAAILLRRAGRATLPRSATGNGPTEASRHPETGQSVINVTNGKLGGDLPAGAARGGLPGGVELAGRQECPYKEEGSTTTPFDMVMRNEHAITTFGTPEVSLDAHSQIPTPRAVSGRDGGGVGGAGGHQVTVDFAGQGGQAGDHVAGPAETGQAVQRAGRAGQIPDLFAEAGRCLEPVPGARQVSGGGRGPGPSLEEVGLVIQNRSSLQQVRDREMSVARTTATQAHCGEGGLACSGRPGNHRPPPGRHRGRQRRELFTPGRDGLHGRRDRSLAASQQPPGCLLQGGRVPGHASVGPHRGKPSPEGLRSASAGAMNWVVHWPTCRPPEPLKPPEPPKTP